MQNANRTRSWILGVMGVAVLAVPGNAKVTSPSPLRKIKAGAGNCVFADAPLPYQKEAAYPKLTTSFTTGDVVFARCYFPSQLADFVTLGKVKNSLTSDDKTYRTLLTIAEPASGRAKKKGKGTTAPAALPSITMHHKYVGVDDWDQREYVLDPSNKSCAFKAHTSATECLDFDKATRDLATLAGQPLPFAAEICLKAFIEYVDEEKWVKNADKGYQEKQPVVKEQVLSEGCFQYTAKPSSSPPPADGTTTP
jgi:hypothetical protein